MRRPSRWGLEPGETILREGRIHPPLYLWILVPLACGAVGGFIVSLSNFEPQNWPYFALEGVLLGLFGVQGTRSWRWRITEHHMQQGNLGWPVFRFDSRTGLAGVTRVDVLTGRGLHREVKIHLGDGPLQRWHRGAVIVRLDETADVKNVIGTDTEAEADELATFLRERVAAAKTHLGYTPPPDHNMRVLPASQDPDRPS